MTGKQESKYQELDVDNKLIMNLRDLGHTLRILFEGKGSQKRILILLYEAEGMTQRELTEKLGVQPGSASEVIGKLPVYREVSKTKGASQRSRGTV